MIITSLVGAKIFGVEGVAVILKLRQTVLIADERGEKVKTSV